MIKYYYIKFQNKLMRRNNDKSCEAINKYFRNSGMTIGKDCKIYSDITTSESYLVNIGDNVTISNGVQIVTHDNGICKVIDTATDIFGKVTIGDNCFIGAKTLILPGVHIGKNNIIGSGSVVTKSFYEEGNIIAGNPAKIIGKTKDYKEKYSEYAVNIDKMDKKTKKEYILNDIKLIEK